MQKDLSCHKVAVIDIGSNSIKSLVAQGPKPFKSLYKGREETRISTGISHAQLKFSESKLQAATESIQNLFEKILPYNPQKILIVGTSALREAQNSFELQRSVYAKTGFDIKILSGEEEALAIAYGILHDPNWALEMNLKNKNALLFDLGGGSLECIHVQKGNIAQAISLPLGAVRLTEQFVGDPDKPLSPTAIEAMRDRVWSLLYSELHLASTDLDLLVGTGGSLFLTGQILQKKEDLKYYSKSFAEDLCPRSISILGIEALLQEVLRLSPAERIKVLEVSPSRADIFPAALVVFLTIAQFFRKDCILHSAHSLRHGLAQQMLNEWLHES